MSVKEVVEVKEIKSTGNQNAEQTNLFSSMLADPVTKFMLILERKALEKSAIKEIFGAILGELKTAFMEKHFKSLN